MCLHRTCACAYAANFNTHSFQGFLSIAKNVKISPPPTAKKCPLYCISLELGVRGGLISLPGHAPCRLHCSTRNVAWVSTSLSLLFPEPQLFTSEQRQTLLKYFDECGMTSTHRRNTAIIQRCASDIGTTVERVKVMAGWRDSESTL